MVTKIPNRIVAGQLLAEKLQDYVDRSNVLVLALPRGGVPVAAEIARSIGAPLDICLVRKLGVPSHPELAMGAIAADGLRVLNPDAIARFGISDGTLDEVTAIETQELQRRQLAYRGDRPPAEIKDRIILLVDDGLATGSTIRAAIAFIRRQQPQQIIAVIPVAPAEVCLDLAADVERVVCLMTPSPFRSIGQWYENFDQTTDDEVRALLNS